MTALPATNAVTFVAVDMVRLLSTKNTPERLLPLPSALVKYTKHYLCQIGHGRIPRKTEETLTACAGRRLRVFGFHNTDARMSVSETGHANVESGSGSRRGGR
jgi:hypothetical protein